MVAISRGHRLNILQPLCTLDLDSALSFFFFLFFCMGPCHNYQHELLCRSKTWAEVTEDNAQKVGCFFFNLWRSFCLCSAMGANNKWAHQPYRDTQPTNHQSFHFIPPATSTAAAKPNRLLNANSFISATALDSASSLALAIRFPHKKTSWSRQKSKTKMWNREPHWRI